VALVTAREVARAMIPGSVWIVTERYVGEPESDRIYRNNVLSLRSVSVENDVVSAPDVPT
jgi:hypothetical protein